MAMRKGKAVDRDHLAAIAISVMREHGLMLTSLGQVAQAAGCSKATVHQTFGGIGGMRSAVILRAGDRLTECLRDARRVSDHHLEVIFAASNFVHTYPAERAVLVQALAHCATTPANRPVTDACHKAADRIAAQLRNMIEQVSSIEEGLVAYECRSCWNMVAATLMYKLAGHNLGPMHFAAYGEKTAHIGLLTRAPQVTPVEE